MNMPCWMREIECYNIDLPLWLDHMIDENNNYTILYWMYCIKTEPPRWMEHKLNCFRTIAMYWVEIIGTDPPEWMRHDADIKKR